MLWAFLGSFESILTGFSIPAGKTDGLRRVVHALGLRSLAITPAAQALTVVRLRRVGALATSVAPCVLVVDPADVIVPAVAVS